MKPPLQRIVFLGTGTGVGKTFSSSTLASTYSRLGRRVLGLKPIESGLPFPPEPGQPSDAALLAAAAGHAPSHCHALRDPVSPHLAARNEGVSLRIPEVRAWVEKREAESPSLEISVIETAGGAFSPLGAGLSNADLAKALLRSGDRLLLVAPNSLGVLHEVTATLLALAARDLFVDWVILSDARAPDASSASNREELENTVFPHLGYAAPRQRTVISLPQGAHTHPMAEEILFA